MTHDDVNKSRRRFLVGATSVVGGVGVVGAAVPFVASWNPSAKAKSAGAPVKVNISKLEPGQQMIVEWRGKPVWVVRRTQEMLQNIDKLIEQGILADPQSEREQQPPYAKNKYRSIKDEYLIAVGLCTHLGCSPKYRPEVGPEDLGEEWLGGFFCPCHGSRFDLAGHVYKSVPAPTNLVIPPHRYLDEITVEVGVDQEAA
ncbi:ubiquinol-cytochrome c reductase iron-sulfur subunit [Hahella sp. SMD15-11]|uniref:Ubiquinol-cytochrome c reductase iron-sulfur subunit n=1 Tax=Thermohahella caldifontis TaxID=3142973 RepID=A0AB39UWX8_9GAMM